MRAARVFTLASAILATSCFAVTDLDKFHAESPSLAPFQDLKFTMRGATSHLTQMFEIRVIDANNIVQARAVYNPMGTAETVVFFPRAVPRVNGPYHLDFYADKNGSGGWDGLDTGDHHDHGWRIDPLVENAPGADPNDSVIEVVYDHNTSFTELNQYPSGVVNPPRDAGVAATLHFVHLDDFQGKFLELRICDASSGRCSGLYRMPQIAVAAVDATLAGVIDPEVDYNVSVYIDANGNGTYDDPSKNAGDFGWKVHVPSTAKGLDFTFDPKALTDHGVDVGTP